MGIFDIFSTKAATIVRDVSDDVANSIRWRWGQWGNVVPLEAKYEAEASMYHPIIYRCIDKIGLAVQGVDWYIEKVGNKDPAKRTYSSVVEKDLAKLLENPNDDMTAAQLKYWTAINFALYGNYFYKIGCDRIKRTPNGIYPLLTKNTSRVINTDTGAITGYKYQIVGGKKVNPVIPTRQEAERTGKIAEGYAGHVYKPTLDYVNKTHSALQALGFAPKIATSLMERAYESATGRPNVKHVVTADKDMTAVQQDGFADAINARKTGKEESGNVLFLAGINAKFQTVDDGMKDIHSKIPLDDMTRQIAALFGVPIPLLGLAAADSAKFAGNYAEARLSFIEDTIIPGYLSPMEDGMTKMLCPDDYEIKFDLDSIEVLRNRRFSVAKDLSVVSFLTPDEKRLAIGYGPLTAKQKQEIKDAQPSPVSAPKPGVAPNGTPDQPDDSGED